MDTRDILIFNDDRVLNKSPQAILRGNRYHVDVAPGLDLLILDVMVSSDLEAHKFAHTILRAPGNRDLPILVITGMRDMMGVNIKDAFEGSESLPSVAILEKPYKTGKPPATVEQMMDQGE